MWARQPSTSTSASASAVCRMRLASAAMAERNSANSRRSISTIFSCASRIFDSYSFSSGVVKNEVTGFLLLSSGLVILLSLVSYHAQDPSWNTAAGSRPLNLIGYPGSYLADVLFQAFGAAALLFPLLIFLLAWRWIRSEQIEAGAVKLAGSVLLTMGACAALSFLPWRMFGGGVSVGGALGLVLARYLVETLNLAGALLATLTTVVVSIR